MAQRSLDLIEAMYAKAKAAQPITGRGIGYKLFIASLIPSMGRPEMQRVYRPGRACATLTQQRLVRQRVGGRCELGPLSGKQLGLSRDEPSA
jgi:hypothetical protein